MSGANHGLPAGYKLHHVGIVVPNLEAALAGYAGRFAFREASLPLDDAIQGVRVAFVRVSSDVYIEFIEPKGDSSPVKAFLAKTRGGYHHVAFEVEDIDSAVAELEAAKGMVVCRPVAAFQGRRIAFLFPNMKPSLLTELLSPKAADAESLTSE